MFSSALNKISHLIGCSRMRDMMKRSRTTKAEVPTVQVSQWREEPGSEGHVITYPSPVFISAFHNRPNIGRERRSSTLVVQSGGTDLRHGALEADGATIYDGAVATNGPGPAPYEDLSFSNERSLHSPGPALPALVSGYDGGCTIQYPPGPCEACVIAPVTHEHHPEDNINASQAGVGTDRDAGGQKEPGAGAESMSSGVGGPDSFHRVLAIPNSPPVVVPPDHLRLLLSFDGQPTFGQLISMAFQDESDNSGSDSDLGGGASVAGAGDSGEGTNGPDSDSEHSPTELVHREAGVAPKHSDSDGIVGASQVVDEPSSTMKVEVKNYHYRRDRNRERYQDNYFYGSLEVIMEEDFEGELGEYRWEFAVGDL